MYSSINEQSDYNAPRRYESIKKPQPPQKTMTKRGNFLENQLRTQCSPGPANIGIFTHFIKKIHRKIGAKFNTE